MNREGRRENPWTYANVSWNTKIKDKNTSISTIIAIFQGENTSPEILPPWNML